MTPAFEEAIRETLELTGAEAPELLADDAPVLGAAALAADAEGDANDFYLIGLIGGKDVGKSALVNALAGRQITASTSHGPGTEHAVAYAHASRAAAVRALLEQAVPGQYRIVTHDLPDLRRQVLLDLPDIDSHYRSHLQITRQALRHLLYPLWIGSVEKYADRQPQQMLAKVAAGNAPENFIFCLNKADQIQGSALGSEAQARSGFGVQGSGEAQAPEQGRGAAVTAPAEELRADYASRIARTLALSTPPRVYVISATQPRAFELPELRAMLSREKSSAVVQESKELAIGRQERSLLAWLEEQDLPRRAQQLEHLRDDVEEAVAARLGPLLLERVVPELLEDPAAQAAMAEEILQQRVARWPVVNLVHTLLAPLFLLMRSVVARHAGPVQSADALVDARLQEAGESPAVLVQSIFGQLRRGQPAFAELYAENKLWESMPADLAVSDLSRRLSETLLRQRSLARQRLAGHGGWLGAPLRWLLTVGAILWFPFFQPILEAALGGHDVSHWPSVAGLLVQVLGVNYLLKSAGFLIIWFVVLWLAVRWNTQRKVGRLLSRWRVADNADPSVSLTAQAMEWMDALSAPIRAAAGRARALSERTQELKRSARVAG